MKNVGIDYFDLKYRLQLCKRQRTPFRIHTNLYKGHFIHVYLSFFTWYATALNQILFYGMSFCLLLNDTEYWIDDTHRLPSIYNEK